MIGDLPLSQAFTEGELAEVERWLASDLDLSDPCDLCEVADQGMKAATILQKAINVIRSLQYQGDRITELEDDLAQARSDLQYANDTISKLEDKIETCKRQLA